MFRFIKSLFCKHDFAVEQSDDLFDYSCKKCSKVERYTKQDLCQHDYDLIDKTERKPIQLVQSKGRVQDEIIELMRGKVVYVLKCKKCAKVDIASREV
jgi:hypothetical protein